MTAPSRPVTVESEAAVALLELAARELRQAVEELGPAVLPLSLLFLTRNLEEACADGVTAFAVELAQQSAYRARRCDLAEAFPRLNPAFGGVHDGCWPGPLDPRGRDRTRQQQVQHRELGLALGQRAAELLCPPPTAADDGQGGETS
jgi:hypothetical protein